MAVVRRKLRAYEFNDLLNATRLILDNFYENLEAERLERAREQAESRYISDYLEKKTEEMELLETAYKDAVKYSYASLKDYVSVDEDGRPEYVYLQVLDYLLPPLLGVSYRFLDARDSGYDKDYVQDLLDKREEYLDWKEHLRKEENDEIFNLWVDFKKHAPSGHRTKRDFAKSSGWSYNRVIEATKFRKEDDSHLAEEEEE